MSISTEPQYYDDHCGECRRPTVGDRCQQCGMSLCPACYETGAEFCGAHPNEHLEGYNEPADPDAYEDLRQATPEELLEATIWYYRETFESPAASERMILFLRLGFRLAQPGGWQRVALMWLRESRKIAALDQ